MTSVCCIKYGICSIFGQRNIINMYFVPWIWKISFVILWVLSWLFSTFYQIWFERKRAVTSRHTHTNLTNCSVRKRLVETWTNNPARWKRPEKASTGVCTGWWSVLTEQQDIAQHSVAYVIANRFRWPFAIVIRYAFLFRSSKLFHDAHQNDRKPEHVVR